MNFGDNQIMNGSFGRNILYNNDVIIFSDDRTRNGLLDYFAEDTG